MINQYYKFASKVETGFNTAGFIPIVGAISGSLHVIAGTVQLVAGATFLSVGVMARAASRSRRFDQVLDFRKENLKHGGLNILRGLYEVLMFGCHWVYDSKISVRPTYTYEISKV